MKTLAGKEIVAEIEAQMPESVVGSDDASVLVESSAIAGVLRYLKESPNHDFNFLCNLTAVDYYDYFEVVYNLVSMSKKQSIMVKTRVTGRDNPEVPSVCQLWAGADVQEREVFDLLGIKFIGHPNLKRIALWEGFEGHPLRKDWKEAYYEADAKPFDARWPGGDVYRAEDENPFQKNVLYPEKFDPEKWIPEGDAGSSRYDRRRLLGESPGAVPAPRRSRRPAAAPRAILAERPRDRPPESPAGGRERPPRTPDFGAALRADRKVAVARSVRALDRGHLAHR